MIGIEASEFDTRWGGVPVVRSHGVAGPRGGQQVAAHQLCAEGVRVFLLISESVQPGRRNLLASDIRKGRFLIRAEVLTQRAECRESGRP
jgi:hypothetical protein